MTHFMLEARQNGMATTAIRPYAYMHGCLRFLAILLTHLTSRSVNRGPSRWRERGLLGAREPSRCSQLLLLLTAWCGRGGSRRAVARRVVCAVVSSRSACSLSCVRAPPQLPGLGRSRHVVISKPINFIFETYRRLEYYIQYKHTGLNELQLDSIHV